MLQSIVVFCGSSSGLNEIYIQQAAMLGEVLARQNTRLVYGGAKVGLMGAVADGVLKNGGKVIGVIPSFLRTKEVAHEGLTELIEVETLHERKLKMHDLSEGIITLPGGWGTMEELFEMMTWAQLGLHPKPIGILNTAGFYDPLLVLINKMVSEGFLKAIYKEMVLVHEDIHELLKLMNGYTVPDIPQWVTRKTT